MNCTLSCARSFRARSERLEDRILLAGDCCVGVSNDSPGVAAFFASSNPDGEDELSTALASELRTLSGAHSEELAELRERFRLDGTGQTVAVIDSGIALTTKLLVAATVPTIESSAGGILRNRSIDRRTMTLRLDCTARMSRES